MKIVPSAFELPRASTGTVLVRLTAMVIGAVTAVGLGPFPGVLALSVHSVGMLGRLFAETIEDMGMGPVDALTITAQYQFRS